MSFANPLALLLLLALPLAAWWLARGARPPSREWPALEFFPRMAGVPATRRRRRLPLYGLCACASLACAVLALAAPRRVIERPAALRVYFDRSASMGARDAAGRSRSEAAHATLAQALAAEPAETPVEIWLWPQLELLHRGSAAEGLPEAARFAARGLAAPEEGPSAGELGGGRIWWCGDRAPRALPARAAFLAVGSAIGANAGIVSARFEKPRELWLVIACAAAEEMELELFSEPARMRLAELKVSGAAPRAFRVDIGREMRGVRLVPRGGGDALALDDAVEIAPDQEPILCDARDLPPALLAAFRADERLVFASAGEAELALLGDAQSAAPERGASIRFGAASSTATAVRLRWESAERDELWRRIEPLEIEAGEVAGGEVIAREIDGSPAIVAREGREIRCGIAAEVLERTWAARAELPLFTAFLVEEASALLRSPRIVLGADGASSPLSYDETRAELAGISRAEGEDRQREREEQPWGRACAYAAALAWLAACLLRVRRSAA